MSLSWTATSFLFFTNYTIEYSPTSASGPWYLAGVISTSQSTTVFSKSGLSPGSTYWWMVVAYGTPGSPEASNVVPVAQPTLAYLNFTLLKATTAKFTWTNNASYGGLLAFGWYGLYQSSGGAPYMLVANNTPASANSSIVTGLSTGSSYSFRLVTGDCYSACGSSSALYSLTTSNVATLGTPLPLSASVAAQRAVIDTGETDPLTCTPSGGQSPFNFSWNLGSGYVPGSSTISPSFSSPSSPKVTCLITDHLASQASVATTLTVNADPLVSLITNRTSADVGEPVSYGCSVRLGTAPYSEFLGYGDGTFGVGGAGVHAYTNAGAFSATCLVTDSTQTEAAASLTVTVSPSLTLSVTSNSLAAAPGTVLSFFAHSTNGSGTYLSYGWKYGDGVTAGTSDNISSHTFATAGTFNVIVAVVDSNGVSQSASQPEVISLVQVSIAALPKSTTAGTSVAFVAVAAGGAGGPYNYTWNFGDGNTRFGPSLSHSYSNAGTFTPTLVVKDRLGGSNSSILAPLVVSVAVSPVVTYVLISILVGAILVGLLVGLLAHRQGRTQERAQLPEHIMGVPAKAPPETTPGLLVCRACGASNLPVATECEKCGKPLQRRLFE